jgi:hypothetical protein
MTNLSNTEINRDDIEKSNSYSALKTSQLMLYKKIISVFSELHKNHINTMNGQSAEFFSFNKC